VALSSPDTRAARASSYRRKIETGIFILGGNAFVLHLWRNELIDDMGGAGNVSTQQKTIIDPIVKQNLILDSVDAWLLERPMVYRASRSVVPIVRECQSIADSLARYLGQLGLKRRSKIKSISDLLADEEADTPRDRD
jgi:hypothetical protein